MIKVKSFRDYYDYEDDLAEKIENFLHDNSITRDNIISLKYFSESHYIYCMLVWEDK